MGMTLQEMIHDLERGEWCSLSVISCNVKKGSAGKVIDLKKCRIARQQPSLEVAVRNTITGTMEHFNTSDKLRDPNHNLHFTRNVELQNRSIITIHPILIFRFNNQTVI